MTLVRAVLLDIDGTLVDSNDAHARTWVDALTQFGHPVSFERVRRLIGMGGDKLLAEIGIDKQSPLGRRIDERKAELFARDHLPHLAGFPQARELLVRLIDVGLTLVVATSAKKAEADALLDRCNARDLVPTRASSDDAESSKPAPDIVEAALALAHVPPEAALMLGDTPYDVRAARRAGVHCVGLRSGGWGDDELDGALVIYDDVADLLAHFESSPFVSGAALSALGTADPASEEARLA
jgi:phosphoglycolate phosphatase-like HAD superfamily hydrolase